jgi:uncharacterized protein YigA (DUF484 family)
MTSSGRSRTASGTREDDSQPASMARQRHRNERCAASLHALRHGAVHERHEPRTLPVVDQLQDGAKARTLLDEVDKNGWKNGHAVM